jgi:hypothetical protein
VKNVLFLLFNK